MFNILPRDNVAHYTAFTHQTSQVLQIAMKLHKSAASFFIDKQLLKTHLSRAAETAAP